MKNIDVLFTSVNEDFILKLNGISCKFVKIFPGKFLMGQSDDKHEETIEESYYIADIPVTLELYHLIMDLPNNQSKKPVVNKSWKEFEDFITRIKQVTHINFRLPTEKEWEYAARGGHKSQNYCYAGSDTLEDVAYFHKQENEEYSLKDVGLYLPNELGLYDMTGNVCELTSDMIDNKHVIKGGAWYNLMKNKFDPGITWITDNVSDRGVGVRLVIQ